jgi:hypothetical protein
MRTIILAAGLPLLMTCGACGDLPAAAPLSGNQLAGASAPASFDVAHAGKKETAEFITRSIPPTISWTEGSWKHSVTQSATPGEDPCVLSFKEHFKDDQQDGDNSRESDSGGSVPFGTSQLAQYMTNQTGESSYLGSGGERDMQLYWPNGPDRRALADAIKHLQTLCTILPEPN